MLRVADERDGRFMYLTVVMFSFLTIVIITLDPTGNIPSHLVVDLTQVEPDPQQHELQADS